MATIPDPRYVTTDATTGAASVFFRGQKPTVVKSIRKITVECPVPGPGTVSIIFRGQLVSSRRITLQMSADGVMALHCGEEVEVRITNGPPSTKIKITAHYEETAL